MKKTIYYFLAIIICNILFIRFYFIQEQYRLIAFFALLALVYAIPKFCSSLALTLTGRSFSEHEINLLNPFEIKKRKTKSIVISAIALIILAGSHVWGYVNYFKYENENLANKGIYTPAIVTGKEPETKLNHHSKFHIHYSYKYNGLVYHHNCWNDTLEIGDTIVVKFLPENPDHHMIIDKIF